ncbi:hydrophobin family protein [Streptomyces mirabilis]|uniref:hydrophobin family protein n=1 Tax=Streptomyces mirabilis TaxID=68239 RepID=UPI00332DD31B
MSARLRASAMLATLTLATGTLAALASAAQAAPASQPLAAAPTANYCCHTVATPDNPVVQQLAGALGVKVPQAGYVGVNCSPLTPFTGCAWYPAYCTGPNYSQGLLVVNCTPAPAPMRRV